MTSHAKYCLVLLLVCTVLGMTAACAAAVDDLAIYLTRDDIPPDRMEMQSHVALAEQPLQSIRTLVLDRSGARETVGRYLKSFGMPCELTGSDADAARMLEADHGFDLLVLDHDTPDEGGFAFVDALQNNCRIAKLPTVLMLLPLMRLDLFDKIGVRGVSAAVGKPVIPSMLLDAVFDAFQLKAVSGTQPTAEAIPNPARSGALRRVLLADDNQTNQLIARYDIADYPQFRTEFDADAEDRGHASLSVLQIWREGETRVWVLYAIADGKRALDYLQGAGGEVFASRAGVQAAEYHAVQTA